MAVSSERQYRADLEAFGRNYPFPRGPSRSEVNRKVAREREEARRRAQKRIDERKAVSQARYEREDVAIRARRGLQTPEERAEEAAATILEVEATKAEDQNWVTEFTPQQEQEIAGYETAVQRVKSGVISGDIGLEDGGRMVQTLNQKIGSYQKIRRPRRKGEPWYPEGRKPNDIFTEGLTTYVVQPDGSPKLMVRPDQTPEYQQMKTQQALEEKQRQAEEKHALLIEKYMRDIRMKDIEETVKDAKGVESVKRRPPTNEEVFGKIQELFPNDFPAPSFGQQQVLPPVFDERPEGGAQAGGGKPITDAEFRKLPEGASYRHADGTIRRKGSQKESQKTSRSANHFPSLVGF